MNENFDQNQNDPFSSHLKECPSCRHSHKSFVPQCEQCGVIFSKWKDPEQRRAEAKLAEIAAEHSQGIPKWLVVTPLALIACLIILFFVPDVEVKILGPALQYKLKPETFLNFSGRLKIEISGDISSQKIPVSTTLGQRIRSLERDSGGNTVYRNTYGKISMEGLPGFPAVLEKPGAELDSYSKNSHLNRFGKAISAGVGDLELATSRIQQMNQIRMRQVQDMQRGTNAFPQPANDAKKDSESDLIASILESLVPSNLAAIDQTFLFEYKKGRLRRGNILLQNSLQTAHAGFFILKSSQSFSWSFSGGERKGSDFLIIFNCETPFSATPPSYTLVSGINLSHFSAEGQYRGTAYINYADGFIQNFEGNFTLKLTGPPEEAKALLEKYGLPAVPSSGEVFIHGQQTITRL